MSHVAIKRYVAPGAVCLLLGLSIALQVKTEEKAEQIRQESRVTEERIAQFLQVTHERDLIAAELGRLREVASFQATQAQLLEELAREQAVAGLLPVQGRGVTVLLADLPDTDLSTSRVRAEDLLLVLNDLRAAGAEALAINDGRVTPRTSITLGGGGDLLLINGTPADGPFLIEAIGDPAVLLASLQMRGGVVQQLEPWLRIEVDPAEHLTIPAATWPTGHNSPRPIR